MTPSCGSPGANRLPSRAISPVRAARAASSRSIDVSSSVRTPWARRTRSRHTRFETPFGGSVPVSTTVVACGKTSMARPFGDPAPYVGKPCSFATRKTSNPTSIHSKNRLPRPWVSDGVLNDWMLHDASSRSVRRERPVAAHRGGESIATTSGWNSSMNAPISAGSHVRAHRERDASLVHQDEVESLPDADVDTDRSHDQGVRCRWAKKSSRSLLVNTPSTCPAFVIEDGGPVLELAERGFDGVVELDHRDRRRHDLGDVGLQGVRVAEDPIEQLAIADGADELRDVRALLPHDGRLRDVGVLEPLDGLPHLVVRPDRDQRRQFAVLRPQDLFDPDHVGTIEHPVLQHPRVGVHLRQVLPAGVGQQHDDRLRLVELASDLQRGEHRAPRRAADQDPLLSRDGARRPERVAVGHLDVAVHHRRVERRGPEVLADPFDQIGPRRVARVHGSLGIGSDDRDRRVLLLEEATDAGDRASRPDPGDEHVDRTVGLTPDLGAGRLVVRRRVLRVEVLVRLIRAGDLLRQPVRHAVVGLRGFRRNRCGADHDLRSVGAQEGDLLLAHLVGHHEDALVSADRGGDRQPVPRVARRGLHDRAARLEETGPFGGLDHPDADPILHGAARVQHLQLREDGRPDASGDRVQPYEWRVAHRVQERVEHFHPHPLPAGPLPGHPAPIVPRPTHGRPRRHGPAAVTVCRVEERIVSDLQVALHPAG